VGSLAPKFLKDLRLEVPDPEDDCLSIELLQAGPRGDLVVGCEDIRIAPLTAQGTLVHWFALKNAAQRIGAELCVVLRYAASGWRGANAALLRCAAARTLAWRRRPGPAAAARGVASLSPAPGVARARPPTRVPGQHALLPADGMPGHATLPAGSRPASPFTIPAHPEGQRQGAASPHLSRQQVSRQPPALCGRPQPVPAPPRGAASRGRAA
jgi:hypothetical protein